MTSLPASRMKLSDRGRIAPGMKADLVLFDPATVIDRSTFAEPRRLSDGIVLTVVNGEPVWKDRKTTGARPGRVLTLGSKRAGGEVESAVPVADATLRVPEEHEKASARDSSSPSARLAGGATVLLSSVASVSIPVITEPASDGQVINPYDVHMVAGPFAGSPGESSRLQRLGDPDGLLRRARLERSLRDGIGQGARSPRRRHVHGIPRRPPPVELRQRVPAARALSGRRGAGRYGLERLGRAGVRDDGRDGDPADPACRTCPSSPRRAGGTSRARRRAAGRGRTGGEPAARRARRRDGSRLHRVRRRDQRPLESGARRGPRRPAGHRRGGLGPRSRFRPRSCSSRTGAARTGRSSFRRSRSRRTARPSWWIAEGGGAFADATGGDPAAAPVLRLSRHRAARALGRQAAGVPGRSFRDAASSCRSTSRSSPAPGPSADAPLFYVTELYGSVKVVPRNGTVSDYATDLLNFDPTGAFPGSGEKGVTGIVVDPGVGRRLRQLDLRGRRRDRLSLPRGDAPATATTAAARPRPGTRSCSFPTSPWAPRTRSRTCRSGPTASSTCTSATDS